MCVLWKINRFARGKLNTTTGAINIKKKIKIKKRGENGKKKMRTRCRLYRRRHQLWCTMVAVVRGYRAHADEDRIVVWSGRAAAEPTSQCVVFASPSPSVRVYPYTYIAPVYICILFRARQVRHCCRRRSANRGFSPSGLCRLM